MKTQNIEKSIRTQAEQIAGCSWEDQYAGSTDSLAGDLMACADQPNAGSDGDLTANDRSALRTLARECAKI